MKKYVRVELLNKILGKNSIHLLKREDLIGVSMKSDAHKITIIKQSDKLEDLCDGIETFDDKNGYIYVDYTMFEDKKDIINKTEVLESIIENMKDEEYSGKNQTIKGYIRTTEGLKYIAKLNDRKEWELL